MNFRLQPVQVATRSDDQEGQLVFAEGFLAAVLVQLSEQHGENWGKWFLEAGFGRVYDYRAPIFADLGEAQAWIKARLTGAGETAS